MNQRLNWDNAVGALLPSIWGGITQLKKETKLLKEKATSSLLLSIDHFNRPWDVGRLEAVLILLDHSFEMLLKASILNRAVESGN